MPGSTKLPTRRTSLLLLSPRARGRGTHPTHKNKMSHATPSADVAHSEPVYNVTYYLKAAIAGGLCCSVTHGAVCPIDVVKCAPPPGSLSLASLCFSPFSPPHVVGVNVQDAHPARPGQVQQGHDWRLPPSRLRRGNLRPRHRLRGGGGAPVAPTPLPQAPPLLLPSLAASLLFVPLLGLGWSEWQQW